MHLRQVELGADYQLHTENPDLPEILEGLWRNHAAASILKLLGIPFLETFNITEPLSEFHRWG